jgi:hypothetical protein
MAGGTALDAGGDAGLEPDMDGGTDGGFNVPGESCSEPRALTFVGGTATVAGSTAQRSADQAQTCGGSGPDEVYSFELTSNQIFTATATTSSPNFQPLLALNGPSLTCAGAPSLTCTPAGISVTIASRLLTPGRYYVWIDSNSTVGGSFDLVAKLSTPVVSNAGESCQSPGLLNFSNTASGLAISAGNLSTATIDSTPSSCAPLGPDAVYVFSLNATRTFQATVSSSTATFRPAMYLRLGPACVVGTEVACKVATASGGTASLGPVSLVPGSYFLWVEAAGTPGGPFTLNASLQ